MRALIGLGSNVGDRLAALRAAVAAFGRAPEVSLGALSRIYETRPLGPSIAPFLDAAAEIHTALSPAELLARLQALELDLGRVHELRWGPRALDLDLLACFERGQSLRSDTASLTLPHPRLFERDFVLRPLLDLDPGLEIGGRAVAAVLAGLPAAQRTILRSLAEALAPASG